MQSDTAPYPERRDAQRAIAENPARFLDEESSNDLTRHAILRGMDSVQRLAWWHRVAEEEGYDVSDIEARRDALLARDEPEESTSASETDERVAEAVAEIEAADSVSAVEALQEDELARDAPEKRVIGAANKRLDELRSEREEEPEPEPAAEETDTRACASCGAVHEQAAYLNAEGCPSCDTRLSTLIEQWDQPGAGEGQEVAA